MAALRVEVVRCREELAAALGVGAARGGSPAGAGAPGAPAPGAPAPAPAGEPPFSIEDGALLSLLALPKGKRALLRASPMLSQEQRARVIAGGLRHLPHYVASAAGGAEAEEADAALAAALAGWVRGAGPPAPAHPAGVLPLLTAWLAELHAHQPGRVVRALLNHPGASEVISALLVRGEAEATAAAAAAAALQGQPQAQQAALILSAVAQWRECTEAVAHAFVESDAA